MTAKPHQQKDITSKRLEEYPDVFADIVNVLAFQGKMILHPEYLESEPTHAFYRDQASRWHENRRDVSKSDRRSGVVLSLIALENQTTQDPDMVFRVMGYDFAAYQRQLASDESRRWPVFTLVLYLGSEAWKQPHYLLEALDWEQIPNPEEWKQVVSNPHINVVELCRLSREIRRQFRSDFWIVAEWFREDQEGLEQELRSDPRKIQHPEALLDFLAAFSEEGNSVKDAVWRRIQEQEQKEGGLTMESLLDKLVRRGRQQGQLEGLQEGLQNGQKQGLLEGQRQIVAFMLQSNQDIAQIAAATGLSLERVRELALMTLEQK